jgi:hypothetical protein
VERFEKQAIRLTKSTNGLKLSNPDVVNGPMNAQTAQMDRSQRHMSGNPTRVSQIRCALNGPY